MSTPHSPPPEPVTSGLLRAAPFPSAPQARASRVPAARSPCTAAAQRAGGSEARLPSVGLQTLAGVHRQGQHSEPTTPRRAEGREEALPDCPAPPWDGVTAALGTHLTPAVSPTGLPHRSSRDTPKPSAPDPKAPAYFPKALDMTARGGPPRAAVATALAMEAGKRICGRTLRACAPPSVIQSRCRGPHFLPASPSSCAVPPALGPLPQRPRYAPSGPPRPATFPCFCLETLNRPLPALTRGRSPPAPRPRLVHAQTDRILHGPEA